ncbi:MAG: UbiD family decarboxylase [Syntrophales bacterium]|nr:UbiD family decarboxylase [Syntrophales bacterium]
MDDLRAWLKKADKAGIVKKVEGADWDLEIGAITELNLRTNKCPILLFDNIKGYPPGYRVISCPTGSYDALALTMYLPLGHKAPELLDTYVAKQLEWENMLDRFPPKSLNSGIITENCLKGKDIDLFKFPVPKWHELDGGRYIGTADAVITRDPDTGDVNLGTYRIMVQNKNTLSLFILPGKHARMHYEKYHSRGKPCPIAISVGHHPLIYKAACHNLPLGKEYNYIGAVAGESANFITEELTGLPIPADSEIVIAGWCPPDKFMKEGPFGEWTGYYASGETPQPIVNVQRIYHRNDPIILGAPPTVINDPSQGIQPSAKIHSQLLKNGISGIKRVWVNRAGGEFIIIVSMRQQYAGHSRDVGMFVLQNRAQSPMGRYAIIVDEDIDPMDLQQVFWALSTRTDPIMSIDIIKRTRSVSMDPMAQKYPGAHFTSRAIIDACIPYERREEFPALVKLSPELEKKTKERWGKSLGFD